MPDRTDIRHPGGGRCFKYRLPGRYPKHRPPRGVARTTSPPHAMTRRSTSDSRRPPLCGTAGLDLDCPRQPHQSSARARRLTVHGSPPAMATATETETDPLAGRRGAPTQSAETVAGEGRRSSPWPPAAAPDEEEAHVASDGRYSPRGGRYLKHRPPLGYLVAVRSGMCGPDQDSLLFVFLSQTWTLTGTPASAQVHERQPCLSSSSPDRSSATGRPRSLLPLAMPTLRR